MMSKSDKVLKHLKSGKLLTKLSSLKKYGLINTGNVIHRLRGRGFAIDTIMVKTPKDEVYAVYLMQKVERVRLSLREAG